MAFPCHQVGAETQRERDIGQAPPVNRLHVWWARRPLTPSRAAIVASLDSADTDPEIFVRQFGIERVQALVQDEPWVLTGELLGQVETDASGVEVFPVDERVLRRLQEEDERRTENRPLIAELKAKDAFLAGDPILARWERESQPLPQPWPRVGEYLLVQRVMGDPTHVNMRIEFAQTSTIKAALGHEISGTPEAVAARLAHSPVRATINTSFVERDTLTQRQSHRRFTRRTYGFSKDLSWCEQHRWLSLAYSHCVFPHKRLRERLPTPEPTRGVGAPRLWRLVTPAMAAGLTDHVWTTEALLAYRVPVEFLDQLRTIEQLFPEWNGVHHSN